MTQSQVFTKVTTKIIKIFSSVQCNIETTKKRRVPTSYTVLESWTQIKLCLTRDEKKVTRTDFVQSSLFSEKSNITKIMICEHWIPREIRLGINRSHPKEKIGQCNWHIHVCWIPPRREFIQPKSRSKLADCYLIVDPTPKWIYEADLYIENYTVFSDKLLPHHK